MRKLPTLTALGLCAALIAGCTSSGDDDSETLKLNVTLGQPSTEYGAAFLAESEGIFEENGIDVTLNSFGGTAATAQLTDGQIDVLFTTQIIPLNLAAQGQDTVTIWAAATNTLPGIVGPPGSSLEALRAGSSCALATTPPGSFVNAASRKLIDSYGLPCDISDVQPQSVVTTVAGGGADVGVAPVSLALPAVEAGEVELLVDPADPPQEIVDAVEPATYPVLVAVGMTDNLDEKREAVERFIASIHQAGQIIADSSPEDLTALLKDGFPDEWGQASDEALTTAWGLTQQDNDLTETRGYLEESAWSDLVEYTGTWGLPDFDPGNSEFAYDERVDMSYWDAAVGD